jgi:hypothetical protein
MTGGAVLLLVVILGAAAFIAMVLAATDGNRRRAIQWGGLWVLCVAIVGAGVLWSMRVLWAGPSDAQMDGLIHDLQVAYPEQITGVSYENSLLDPPTIFLDVAESMSREDERRLICVEVKPKVDAVSDLIDILSTRIESRDCTGT